MEAEPWQNTISSLLDLAPEAAQGALLRFEHQSQSACVEALGADRLLFTTKLGSIPEAAAQASAWVQRVLSVNVGRVGAGASDILFLEEHTLCLGHSVYHDTDASEAVGSALHQFLASMEFWMRQTQSLREPVQR